MKIARVTKELSLQKPKKKRLKFSTKNIQIKKLWTTIGIGGMEIHFCMKSELWKIISYSMLFHSR